MLISLFFFVSFRLDPPVSDVHRSDPFMDTFTLLDQDLVTINGTGKDVFVALQPHSIMGSFYSTTYDTVNNYNSNGDGSSHTIKHRVGDRFYVSDKILKLNYTYRGGIVVNVWSIPRGICDPDYAVFTSNQREAEITLNTFFETDRKICWFLNFQTPVEFSARFENGSDKSSLRVGDMKHLLTNHFYTLKPKDIVEEGGLNRTHVVALDAKKGPVSLKISIKSEIPYADWTDKPSLFMRRGENRQDGNTSENADRLETYLVTVREVEMWIWVILFGIISSIFGFTVIIFFVHPIKKIHRSLSQPEDLAKAAKTKAE